MSSGKSWEGGVALVPIECHPEQSEGSPLMEEGVALLQLQPERLYDSGEKLERGQSPLSNIGRSLATLE